MVATPERFIDHLQQGNTCLSRISFVVMDEADILLDMGFEPQIREVLHARNPFFYCCWVSGCHMSSNFSVETCMCVCVSGHTIYWLFYWLSGDAECSHKAPNVAV